MTEALAYNAAAHAEILLVPLEQIRLINPRERSKKKFALMVNNIGAVGLKKPITARMADDGKYELVCGQGRLEAFQQLGETNIPVVVLDITREELLLMSIIENSARSVVSTMDSIADLAILREQGGNCNEIGRQVGMSGKHVGDLLKLYDKGEERLLNAVRNGEITLQTAMIISEFQGQPMQEAIMHIQSEQQLSAQELKRLRAVFTTRKALGPRKGRSGASRSDLSADSIVRAVKREQERQRETLKKAQLCEKRLVFVVNAMKTLFLDDYFKTLLRAEGLADLPRYLADAMNGG